MKDVIATAAELNRHNARHPWEPAAVFPVEFLALEKGDKGHGCGYRYRVDQVDGDQAYFRSRARALEFIVREGMRIETCVEMRMLQSYPKSMLKVLLSMRERDPEPIPPKKRRKRPLR